MHIQRSGSVWRGFGSAGPAGFYAMAEAGLFFDFSDPRTLFTDAAGSAALTTPGQTIGLVGDKSRARSPVTSYAGVQASAGLRPAWGRGPKSRRNLLLATATLATQSRAVVATAHTLSFKGTGTITLTGASTAGPLVGTGAVNRVTLTFTPTAGSLTLTVSGSVTDAQMETGGAATVYQLVASAFDMSETSQPAFGYARLDGVDDKLTVTLPGAITGDLMLFGRTGSWIESGVTLPSGAFDLGPTGTVLTPGVLRALGDLVGVVIIARTTTADERARALRCFAAQGAAGWLVAGTNVVNNLAFGSDTIWTKGTGWTIAAGVATHAAGVGSDIEQAGLIVEGQAYLLNLSIVAVRASSILYVWDGTAYMDVAASLTVGPRQAVFVARASGPLKVRLGAAADADIDNVTLKPLTVA